MNRKPRLTIWSIVAGIWFVLGGAERVIAWLSGAVVDDTEKASENVSEWFSKVPLIGNDTAQMVMLLLGLFALSIVIVSLVVGKWWTGEESPGEEQTETDDRVRSKLQGFANSDRNSPEWRSRVRNFIKGSLGDRYAIEFDGAAWGGEAKAYLDGLAARVDGALLASSRRERQNESQRLVASREILRELVDSPPSDFTKKSRMAVSEWSDRCVTALQELLSDEHDDAWKKIHCLLYFTDDAKPDEVRDGVDKAIRHLRTIYAKLTDSMLSTSFSLRAGD